jgi:DNA adenine methylase
MTQEVRDTFLTENRGVMLTECSPKLSPSLRAPFSWFGGKSLAAPLIWQALGDPVNFVEPFFGSGAALLARPHPGQIETVNDLDAEISNFWRALQHEPDTLASLCDTPVSEVDQHAFHTWLVEPSRRAQHVARLMGDPDYYDVLRAARWCSGLCMWIGGGWCSGEGPWQSVDGKLVHLGDAGRGVHRKLVHLGDAGQGVHRKLVHLGDAGQGVHRLHGGLYAWFAALQARLRYVRVCCGDWTRVLGPSPTYRLGLTGILLDPPYPVEADREMGLYREEDGQVAHAVEQWCAANGDNPLLRIVLCGYGTSHDALLAKGWTRVTWQTNGGYGNIGNGRGRANRQREVLWLSPACLTVTQQLGLFAEDTP